MSRKIFTNAMRNVTIAAALMGLSGVASAAPYFITYTGTIAGSVPSTASAC